MLRASDIHAARSAHLVNDANGPMGPFVYVIIRAVGGAGEADLRAAAGEDVRPEAEAEARPAFSESLPRVASPLRRRLCCRRAAGSG